MPHSDVSSIEVRRWAGAAAVGAAFTFGLASEWMGYGWDRPIRWIPDLLVGLAYLIAGGLALPAARGTGVLLAATGLAWYAGNLDASALYWHRGPLVHLLLTYPAWRPRSRLAGTGVAVGYLAALGSAWQNDFASITTSLVLIAVLIRERSTSTGRARHARAIALWAGIALSAALVAGTIARITVPGGAAVLPALWLYEAVLCAIAIGLCLAAQRQPIVAATDLVVDLGEKPSATIRDALAQTLGDPSLHIGYWRPDTGDYVDAAGAQVVVPDGSADRSVRHIERHGRPYAVLIHDPAILADATLDQAVRAAALLSASNEALNSDVRARVAEVVASRRRLVLAADGELRRLEERLHDSPRRRLVRIRAKLLTVPPSADSDHVGRAVIQLDHTLAELDTLARGLHPRDLAGGLGAALQALAARSPVPVQLAIVDKRFPAEIETAVYYVCAEALANVSKHASARAATIDVAGGGGHLTVIVRDDGVGGADQSRGTGLRGMSDRVEALGGRLAIESAPGCGTTLTVQISLDAYA